MLLTIADHFPTTPLLAVMDSWFGNASLWKPVRRVVGERFHIITRLRSNNVLYDPPEPLKSGLRGRRSTYGQRLGSTTTVAQTVRPRTTAYLVNLYGQRREVQASDRIIILKTLKCPVLVQAV